MSGRNPTYIYKVLAQLSPVLNELTDAFVVPPNCSALIQSIMIANGSGTDGIYTFTVAIGGEPNSIKQAIHNGVAIQSGDAKMVAPGWTLSPGDTIRVTTSVSDVSFNIFGALIMP
jgi:hypothetical protein